MTTSGTTNFNLDIIDIIEEAYDMVGAEGRVGYDLKKARRSLNLLTKEWGNRGINMWTILGVPVEIAMGAYSAPLPTDIIDAIDVAWRTGEGQETDDRLLTRVSIAQQVSTTNKLKLGTPSQYYITRRVATPTIFVWPAVNVPGGLFVWYLRAIQDVGSYTNTMDIPGRFLPALTCGLAYFLSLKTIGAEERVPVLQAEYERQFGLAAEEDRDRASFFMVPDLRAYNR